MNRPTSSGDNTMLGSCREKSKCHSNTLTTISSSLLHWPYGITRHHALAELPRCTYSNYSELCVTGSVMFLFSSRGNWSFVKIPVMSRSQKLWHRREAGQVSRAETDPLLLESAVQWNASFIAAMKNLKLFYRVL